MLRYNLATDTCVELSQPMLPPLSDAGHGAHDGGRRRRSHDDGVVASMDGAYSRAQTPIISVPGYYDTHTKQYLRGSLICH